MPGCVGRQAVRQAVRQADARAQMCRQTASEDQTSPGISPADRRSRSEDPQAMGGDLRGKPQPIPVTFFTPLLLTPLTPFIFGSKALNRVGGLLEVLRDEWGSFQGCFILFSFLFF